MKKRLIYQYWDGPISVGCKAGIEVMKQYANTIGVDYRFDDNPQYFRDKLGEYQSKYFGAFRPIYDPEIYTKYDQVLFTDTDIFPVETLGNVNIFDQYQDADLGICSEPMQPMLRKTSAGMITSAKDEKWSQTVAASWELSKPIARTKPENLVKVYNTGVVLYSREGMRKCREQFIDPKEYGSKMKAAKLPQFYTNDQPYLHAMLFFVKGLDWVEMDNGWNSFIHYFKTRNEKGEVIKQINDCRDENTKFVHIQLAGADKYDAELLNRIANRPKKEWENSL